MPTFTAMSAAPFAAAFVLFLLPTVLPTVGGSNILVFMPMPLKSHVFGFQPMFEELARRGHNVTVVSSFPLTGRRVANYTDVDVSPQNFPGRYVREAYSRKHDGLG